MHVIVATPDVWWFVQEAAWFEKSFIDRIGWRADGEGTGRV